MSKQPLTPKQQETYSFIRAFIIKHGYSPSLKEVCAGVDVSSIASAFQRVQRLADKGWVKKRKGYDRSLQLTERYPYADRVVSLELEVTRLKRELAMERGER